MPKFAKPGFTLLLTVLLVGAGTWFWYLRPVPPLVIPGAQTASPPLTLEPFQLIDHRKQPFANERMKGHWSIAFFGYTHYPLRRCLSDHSRRDERDAETARSA